MGRKKLKTVTRAEPNHHGEGHVVISRVCHECNVLMADAVLASRPQASDSYFGVCCSKFMRRVNNTTQGRAVGVGRVIARQGLGLGGGTGVERILPDDVCRGSCHQHAGHWHRSSTRTRTKLSVLLKGEEYCEGDDLPDMLEEQNLKRRDYP